MIERESIAGEAEKKQGSNETESDMIVADSPSHASAMFQEYANPHH
jgi:hypothetical protein